MRIALVSALACAIAISAGADGPQLVNGHLPGPITVLKLTDTQLLTVRTMRVFLLTTEQRSALKKGVGFAPSVIQVLSKQRIEGGVDGCILYNWSYWVSEREVEVPHSGLLSDEQAVEKANDLDEI